MKFLNFLFAFLLVAAFTSCDATKKVTSATPSAPSVSTPKVATARSVPAAPKVTKPAVSVPKVTKPDAVAKVTKPKVNVPKVNTPKVEVPAATTPDVSMTKPKVNKPTVTKPKLGKVKKPGVKKPGMNPTKDKVGKVRKPGAGNPMKTPGKITWEAANERYSAVGTFKRWRMTDVKMVGDDISTLTAKLEIDLTSISEKNPKLTNHLKQDDYFGVEKHQLATIHVTEVVKGDKMNTANMVLKMRGKEQQLKGTFEVVSLKPLTIKGSAMMDRSIFGIGVENTSVPNEIKVMFDTVVPR